MAPGVGRGAGVVPGVRGLHLGHQQPGGPPPAVGDHGDAAPGEQPVDPPPVLEPGHRRGRGRGAQGLAGQAEVAVHLHEDVAALPADDVGVGHWRRRKKKQEDEEEDEQEEEEEKEEEVEEEKEEEEKEEEEEEEEEKEEVKMEEEEEEEEEKEEEEEEEKKEEEEEEQEEEEEEEETPMVCVFSL